MLGLVDKSWMIDLIDDGSAFDAHEVVEQERRDGEYAAYFGLGQSVRLLDRPRVFRLSPAGLALGAYLTKSFDDDLLRGRLLDLGTGSGALAILLRGLGGSTIVATDISRESVDAAAANELVNYSTPQIEFCTSDVFAGLGQEHGKFDAIVFNPPGWRTPSPEVRKRLQAADTDDDELDLSSMFYGDEVLLKFFYELPDRNHSVIP